MGIGAEDGEKITEGMGYKREGKLNAYLIVLILFKQSLVAISHEIVFIFLRFYKLESTYILNFN